MAFNDLQMKAMSESALQAVYSELVKLQDFAHSYSELEDRVGASIVIPSFGNLSAAADFQVGVNQYDSGVNEVEAATLTLNKHLVKSLAITDRQLAETGIQWAKDAGVAIAKTLGRALNAYVFGMMNETNIPLSASINLNTKAGATALYKVAADNGLDVGDSVVVLNPTEFAKLLQHVDFAQYGSTDAIRYGYVPGFAGFVSVVASTNLPENVDGVVINRNSVGIASRYLQPMPGAYPNTWKAVDPDSGFTIGFREFADLGSGTRFICGESIVAAGLLYNGTKAVRLIAS